MTKKKLKVCESCNSPSFNIANVKLWQLDEFKEQTRSLTFKPLCVYCLKAQVESWIEQIKSKGLEP